jgi:hypothetical protein
MPDIPQPTGLPAVDSRREGRKQGTDERGLPQRRAVETYQEVDRVRPPDDRVTIIGIPISQITSSTQAALAGLVAENATLRAQVRRLENRATGAPPLLGRDAFIARLNEVTAASPGPGAAWLLMLIHVQTYEDIRRSTGLLAANSVLADVGQRLQQVKLAGIAGATVTAPETGVPLTLVGAAGGLSLGALVSVPESADPRDFAQQVHAQLTESGYDVAGLSMALAITVAAAPISHGESALLAMGRVDHLTRGPQAVS